MLSLPPLSLYIHIPWCVQKCPYCDFNSHVREAVDQAIWVNAIISEIQGSAAIEGVHSSKKAIEKIISENSKLLKYKDDINFIHF